MQTNSGVPDCAGLVDCAGGTVLDDDAANGASLRSSSQNDISTKTAEDEDSK